jgi:hypothetical protein
VIVLPDGQEVEAGPILLEEFARTNGHGGAQLTERR